MKNINWWLVNGVWTIAIGLMGVLFNLGALNNSALIGLGLNVLIGIALIYKSKLAFWVSLILIGISFVSNIALLSSKSGAAVDLNFILVVISLALLIMLWQEIRKGKGNKK